MEKHARLEVLTTGLALFSMFFGAGNIVFPLALGQLAGANIFYAILGLICMLINAFLVDYANFGNF